MFTLLAGLISVALYFLRFRIPFLPRIFSIELSVLPELVVSIAYGPLYGLAICFVKTAIHVVFNPENLVTDTSGFIYESVFIGIAGIIYLNRMFPKKFRPAKRKVKRYREKSIVIASLVGSAASVIVMFFLTYYLVYPFLMKNYPAVYTEESVLNYYTVSLDSMRNMFSQVGFLFPKINRIWQGILLFNLPVTFMKYVFVTLLTLIIYSTISPVLHFRIPERVVKRMQSENEENSNEKKSSF